VKPIFISYSSQHRDLTRALVGVIEAQYGAGSVWWDHELESRASYAEQIRAALEEARVVVVLWTAGAMISDYVYAEAVGAQAQGKLVNVRPADMRFSDIPEPFNIHHIDDAEDHARILATIAKVMTGEPIPTRVPLHELYFRQHGHRLIDAKQRQLARDPREIAPTELGLHEEALAASQEAVDFYRRLAQDRPDAFLPELAGSISVTWDVLTALDRQTEAAPAAHEALEILAPFVERYPETLGSLARAIGAIQRRRATSARLRTARARCASARWGRNGRRRPCDRGAQAVDRRHPGRNQRHRRAQIQGASFTPVARCDSRSQR